MKYLILIAVVVVVGWLTLGRRNRLPKRGKGADGPGDGPADAQARQPKTSNSETNNSKARDTKDGPQTMLSCTHCGLHLPQADAVFDAQGRVFCGAAHRLAGPR